MNDIVRNIVRTILHCSVSRLLSAISLSSLCAEGTSACAVAVAVVVRLRLLAVVLDPSARSESFISSTDVALFAVEDSGFAFGFGFAVGLPLAATVAGFCQRRFPVSRVVLADVSTCTSPLEVSLQLVRYQNQSPVYG